ncbi:MAG: RDD family protein [Burkholderiales bacterium]
MLDTLRSVATPEGIELELRLAGPAARAVAWLVDLLVRVALYLSATVVLAPLAGMGSGLALILVFALEWLYPAVFEAVWNGQTPGKRVMKIAVLRNDGTPIGWHEALVRNLLRAIDFLPFCYGIGLTAMLINRDFKRLGDLVAGTVVVYRDHERLQAMIPVAPPQAPRVPLALAEQRAVLAFAGRVPVLTPERAAELAEIPVRLTGQAQGPAAVERLLRIANFLIGRSAP